VRADRAAIGVATKFGKSIHRCNRIHLDLLELELPGERRVGSLARAREAMIRFFVARVFNPCLAARIATLGTGWKPVLQVLFLTLLSIAAQAQTVSLPLDGYYRPGAYMPVAVNGATPVSIGATPGVASVAPRSAGVAPVYVYSATAERLQCGEQSLTIHALADDEKLVGLATHDEALVKALFPSNHIAPVELNPTNPLPGPAIAWDSLDAVVVDAIDAKLIPELLAAGTTIAVRSDSKPDETWPWKRLLDAWVIDPDDAYRPTYGWTPMRSTAVRQMVITIAILASCAMLALAMWRSRLNLPVLGAFVLVFCTGLVLWRARQPDVMSMTMEQRFGGDVVQVDRWTYQTSPVATKAEMKFEPITWPVFASAGHMESLHPILECDATGQPIRFRYELPANARMAFVTRTVTPSR
jgi:hypothetical protein